jgi:hypothetical protein
LRDSLDFSGLNDTKIVLGDLCCGNNHYCMLVTLFLGGSDWDDMAKALLNDSTFRDAVSVMGSHYPWASESTELAGSMGIPLWSSEDDSTYWSPVGIGCLARLINVRRGAT